MSAVDGSIRISTMVDIGDAEKDLGKLNKSIERTASKIEKAIKGLDLNPAKGLADSEGNIRTFESAIIGVSQHIEDLKSKMEGLAAAPVKTDEYAELESRLAKVDAQLDRMKEKQEKMRATGVKENSKAWVSLQYDIDRAEEKAEMYDRQLQEMRAGGLAFVNPKDTAEYETLNAELKETQSLQERLNGLMDTYRSKLASAGGAGKAAFGAAKSSAASFSDALKHMGKRVLKVSLAMLSVRGIFGILRRAASTYASENEEVSNRIASAWSALGAMLSPVINFIANLLSQVIGYINVFVRALTGIDYIAQANARALNKQAVATTKLADAQKKQSAGFDEQNILQDPSSGSDGGSGGGGGAATFSADLDPDLVTKIEWLADHFKDILWYVGAIGAGILAWKIGTAFMDALGLTSGQVAGIAIAVAGAVVYVKGFVDAWNNGIDWQNLIEMLGGVAVAAIALGLAFGPTAAAITMLVGGIGLLVVGFKEWIETGELSTQAFVAIEAGILLVAGALAILTANPIILLVGAIVALAVAVATHTEEIKETFSKVVKWLDEHVIQPVVNFFKGLWKSIKDVFSGIGTWFKDKFNAAKDGVKNGFSGVATWFKERWKAIKEVFSNVKTWFKDKFTGARDGIKSVFNNIPTFFSGIWGKIKTTFSNLGTKIGSAISGAFKSGINGIISSAESIVNKAVGLINGAIGIINKIPGVNIGTISTVSFPRLAKGGIVNNPGRGVPLVAGEAGREAVLPLENNTEWMDTLAEKINGGQVVVPIYLGNRLIAKYIVDLQKKQAFATNGVM